jgi:hypothetical protein
VHIKAAAFYDAMPQSMGDTYSAKVSEEVADASSVMVPISHTTWQYIQEDCNHSVQLTFGTLVNNKLFSLYCSLALSVDSIV